MTESVAVLTLLCVFLTLLAVLIQQRTLRNFARTRASAGPGHGATPRPDQPVQSGAADGLHHNPTDEERTTRKRTPLWDRTKFIALLTLVWFVLVWASMADNPLLSFQDALRVQAREAAWVFVLLGVELVRQLHFLVSEHSTGYHRFWTERVFGATDRLMRRRFSDWTRFRLSRALKCVSLHAPALDAVFSGDTLFHGGPGATGRSFSDFGTIIESIRRRLLTLPPATAVHTGHGDSTTVGAEAAHLDEWITRGR
jgi:hypothetical protein